ncbi:helix-turn-helix domain-containing protein [Deinococcus radiophilus]|uniref:helix-turn-helix domain-containing protein n=1 Tax=Deinococcus radiophilus TaxID=32062 RepID=UPI003614C952
MVEKRYNLTGLKGIREARGITQQQLSEQAGVSIATIQKQEQGVQRDVSLSIALPIAQALEVSVEQLFCLKLPVKT